MTTTAATEAPTKHAKLRAWVEEIAELTQPDSIHWCDGSAEEFEQLCNQLVEAGTFERLNDDKRPGSYLALSDPGDVARVEDRTFICSENEHDAGPTNNWRDPDEMRQMMRDDLYAGCMRGRTMYVVPFSMGPLGSPISHIGVQLTDSAYVAVSMRVMTRMGAGALEVLGEDGHFVPCLHSVGAPLEPGEEDVAWPCNPDNKYIVHFPESREIWSFGSGYGGNALLGKKCFALRIASVLARDEGWMAEHMLILKLTSPEGEVKFIAAAFPSRLRQDQPGDADPDDRGLDGRDRGRRHRLDEVRRGRPPLRGQPRGRLLRRRARHGGEDQPQRDGDDHVEHRLHQLRQDRRRRRLVGGHDRRAAGPPDRLARQRLDARVRRTRAAHPNARFSVPAAQCPTIAPEWEDPAGVPIDAFLFGGRRSTVVPLVSEAFDWEHGVFLAATMASETTAAAAGQVGQLRFDPMAMLPFCGYNMADYFGHWLNVGRREGAQLPRIFYVNWFRKDDDGKFLWPGFGENSRVLEWIFRRLEGKGETIETPLGGLPPKGDLDVEGLDISDEALEELLTVDGEALKAQLPQVREHLAKFGDDLPAEITAQLERSKRASSSHAYEKLKGAP